jgi:hypothetical protein
MPRSKRSSVVEAHEIFTKYHRHREGDSNHNNEDTGTTHDNDQLLQGVGNLDLEDRDHKVMFYVLCLSVCMCVCVCVCGWMDVLFSHFIDSFPCMFYMSLA